MIATEQEAPRKLPAPEIAQRVEMLQERIRPLIIANFMEPSHHLINSLVQCVEDGRVRYIEWSRCTSRTQEVNNIKEDGDLKVWKADSSGAIRATSKEPTMSAVLTTELDVHHALRRRGVAYEVAQAMSFEVHERIINYFFFELKKEPMEGFAQVTLQQVAAADRELHVRLAEATRGGFRNGPAGELPLDLHVQNILDGPELKWLLMPLPKRSIGKAVTADTNVGKTSKEDEPKRNRTEPSKNKQEVLRIKKLKRTPMPKQLVGCVPCNEEGQPICFGFNLGSCPSSGDLPQRSSHLLQERLLQTACLCHGSQERSLTICWKQSRSARDGVERQRRLLCGRLTKAWASRTFGGQWMPTTIVGCKAKALGNGHIKCRRA